MSARLSHRTRSAAVALVSAAVLVGVTGSVAAADPPALDRNACATVLARAAIWPGTMSGDGSGIRLVSDGFDSYLARQSPCADPASGH